MIQQVHAAVFCEWDKCSLEQKRSAITMVKRLTTDWQKTYRLKVEFLEQLFTNPAISCNSPGKAQKLEAQTEQFVQLAEKMKGKIDAAEEATDTFDKALVLEEQAGFLDHEAKRPKANLEDLREFDEQTDGSFLTGIGDFITFTWPQGDPDVTYAESVTSEPGFGEDGEVGIQFGGRGGGNGGACAIM